MMKLIYKQYSKFFSYLLVLLVGVFFIRSLKNNWDKLQGVNFSPDTLVVLAVLSFILSVVITGLLWGRILKKMTSKHYSNRDIVRVQLMSWLMKYIPGQAGSFLGKIGWAKQQQIDGKKITASFIYENIFLLLASVIISIPPLFVVFGTRFTDSTTMIIPLLLSVPVILFILKPSIFQKIINSAFKLIKKGKLSNDSLLSYKDSLMFTVEFILPRLVNSLGFVLLAVSLLGIPTSQYIIFGSIYILAGIIGILAVFTPSGLGVRELVIVVLTSNYIPTEQAIALSLVARFYATIADLFIIGLYYILKPRRKGEA